MHNHLEKSYSRDTNVFEVLRICSPWLSVLDRLLLLGIVTVEGITLGIDELDIVVEL